MSTKIHLLADAQGLPLAAILTPGQAHDSTVAAALQELHPRRAKVLLGDKGYDTDAIRQDALSHGTFPVIAAKADRRERPTFRPELYRERNRIERLVNRLKQFRRIATRYEKTARNFLAFTHLAAIVLWTKFVHTP